MTWFSKQSPELERITVVF